jgi:hypothetical protein
MPRTYTGRCAVRTAKAADKSDEACSLWQENLLHQIFVFSHDKPSTNQDSATIRDFLALIMDFGRETPRAIPKVDSIRENILLVARNVQQLLNSNYIRIFGGYACALYCKQYQHKLALYILGLDGWSFDIHPHYSNTEGPTFMSNSAKYTSLFVGYLPVASFEDFTKRLDSIFALAVSKHGSARSSVNNHQGHQRTPAFVFAVCQDALAARY